MLRPGSVFAHYELEAVAGSGGMGVVYRAHDLRLRRRVALKIIAPQHARDALVRERLNREATVAASVLHPNVVPVYEAGEHDETAYIATRWIEGVTLKDLVSTDGPLDPARAARILEQVAAALNAAHDAGLIHRDVTPANVMLSDGDHAYLTDFGLTRRSTDVTGLTATGQLLGTLDYVAPEQIEGAPVDRRSDVYSLGCLGYFLLCGEPPFPRDGHAAKLYAHLSADYVPLAERNPEVPPALDAALRAAMAKAPSDRPPTAAGFAQLLHPVTQNGSGPVDPLHDEPPAVPPPPPPAAPKARRPRRRLEVALGVASALVLVAAAVALFIGLRDRGAGVETIQVGKNAASVSTSDGRVLVAGGRNGTVTRLSGGPAGGARREVVVGGLASHAQEAAGRLYVAGGHGLTILDNRAPGQDKRIQLPGSVGALSAQGGVAWVALRDRPALARVGRFVAPIALAHPAAAVQVAGNTVWVADPAGASLHRFDAATGRPIGPPIPTRGRPIALAVAGRALWVVDARRRALLRLDALTGRTAAPPVPLPGQPVAVAADAREVWVASAGRNVASRIDARTGRPIEEVGVARGPSSIALTPSAAWVISARGELTRIPR